MSGALIARVLVVYNVAVLAHVCEIPQPRLLEALAMRSVHFRWLVARFAYTKVVAYKSWIRPNSTLH